MSKGSQATWGGRFKEGPADLMVRFSESISFDQRLAPFDISTNKAHAAMLCKVGLLSKKDNDAIRCGLDVILKEIEEGRFRWDAKLEDIHMSIEQALTRRVPAAACLHAARSRNDQVATDMRLFFKRACRSLDGALKKLLLSLVDQADLRQTVRLPGYTHLQRAQPVSFAHHLLAYAEMFQRDRKRFERVWEDANVCPLGAGAIAGTTLPIDREFVARELGFVNKRGRAVLTANSMDAVADRDLFIDFAAACALCGVHFSRIAEDLILFSSAEFGFIALPDAFTTGSSLMPQKKNPDALELLRGKAARLQGNLHTLLTLVKGLPLTYNRDLQEDKPPLFDSFDQTLISLHVLEGVLSGMTVNSGNCLAAAQDSNLLATDLVDYLVARKIPFRKAHRMVGKMVALAEREKVSLTALTPRQLGPLGKELRGDWKAVFDLDSAFKNREKTGMPGPRQVKKRIARWRRILKPQG